MDGRIREQAGDIVLEETDVVRCRSDHPMGRVLDKHDRHIEKQYGVEDRKTCIKESKKKIPLVSDQKKEVKRIDKRVEEQQNIRPKRFHIATQEGTRQPPCNGNQPK